METLPFPIEPSDALLLWCIRRCADAERADRIKTLVRKGIDWSRFLEASCRHGLVPFVQRSLESGETGDIPKEILDRLRENFRKNVLWNLGRTREMVKLLDFFTDNGIQAIPYKGPVLAQMVYGDLSMRQFDDLDFFVRKETVKKVKGLLAELGYRVDFLIGGRQEDIYLGSKDEYGFWNDTESSLVEIHWEIVPRYFSIPLDVEEWFSRLAPVLLSGREVMTFCAEDLLLILCVHGGKHSWKRLGWVCDAARVIEVNKEMDWERILDRAQKMKIVRIVLLALFFGKGPNGC